MFTFYIVTKNNFKKDYQIKTIRYKIEKIKLFKSSTYLGLYW